MKLVFHSLLTLICSVFALAATASDFEHTWYGYQKFLSSNDTKEWFFQCGSDVQSEFLPLGNFKIQKQNDDLILFTVIEHEWRKKEANFGATRIHFSGEVFEDYEAYPALKFVSSFVKFDDFSFEDRDHLRNIFKSIAFTDGEAPWNWSFEDYFEIQNTYKPHTSKQNTINLDSGAMLFDYLMLEEKVTVISKRSVLPDYRNKTFTTNDTYEIEYGTLLDCRGLKSF